MFKDLISHNGFSGSVEVDVEGGRLHGKLLFVRDLVTYTADSIPALICAFNDAVDDYLETCRELGRSPDKPASGTFNVRVGEDTHRGALLAAARCGESLNEFVTKAIDFRLGDCRELKLQITTDEGRFYGETVGPNIKVSYETGVTSPEVGYERKH